MANQGSNQSGNFDFLAGGGQAGALIRAQDWSAHPLGLPEVWPQPLKTAVGLMLSIGHPMCLCWGADLALLYNDAYTPILTTRHPQAMGRPVAEVWADIWPDIASLVDQVLAGQAIWQEDLHLVMSRDGRAEDTWWTFSYSPLRDEGGAVRGFVNICNDMTGKLLNRLCLTEERDLQRKTFEALSGSEARFRALVNASSDVVYRMSPDWTEMHQLAGRNFLADTDAPSVQWLDEYLFTEDRPAVMAAIAEAVQRQGVFELNHRVRRRDGSVGWTSSRAVPVFAPDGSIVEWFGMASDISDRKRTEARREARAQLSDLLRNRDDPVDIAHAAAELIGRTLGLSRAGYSRIDQNTETLHTERDWTAPGVDTLAGVLPLRDYGSFIDTIKRGERVVIGDVRLDERTAGHAAALEAHNTRSFFNAPVIEHGRLVAVFFVNCAEVRDWSEPDLQLIEEFADRTRAAVERARGGIAARAAAKQLRELNETLEAQVTARTTELHQFRDIVEATASPICAFDTQYRLIAFNRAHNDEFRRVNGFDTQLGDVFPDLFVADQQPVMRALMSRALSGERFTVKAEFGRPELGTPTWEISYTPLRDKAGVIIGAFHLATDISDRLRAEADLAAAQEALRQSQKMEAMGSLTGGVAHDFNNLLTPIVGALDLLGRKGFGGEREQRLIAGAALAAERAKVLVQRLLAFARRQPLQPIAVDIAQLVRGMADLVASTTGPQIRVVVDIAADLPRARTDPNQLEMALLNLAVNARDAMPDGGTLRISAAADTLAAGSKTGLLPGTYVRLSVADTGSGMEEATLARAIEPFFSTKGIGKGTGLGLSMVHGFVSQLGGGLAISSKLGLGTHIELWLPQTENAPEAPIAIPSEAAAQRRGRALLVDDEEIVRLSTADMLGELGYEVVEAASAEEALRVLEGGSYIDLLLTDHLMPGMTGTDLARAATARHPGLPVLIVSGYAEVDGIAPDLPRLTKPFRKDELLASLAGLRASAGN